MSKKSVLTRVDVEYKKYIKRIQQKLAMRGIIVSERRISLALTRVPGQEELLLNSDWLSEEIRRASK